MNRLFSIALSTLSVVAVVSPSFAQDIVASKTHSTKFDRLNETRTSQNINHNAQTPKDKEVVALKKDSNKENQLAPVTLVNIAFQGFLEDQGIKSGSAFLYSVTIGDVTAEKLVQSAIDKGRLSPETINDEGYINIVQDQLDFFGSK